MADGRGGRHGGGGDEWEGDWHDDVDVSDQLDVEDFMAEDGSIDVEALAAAAFAQRQQRRVREFQEGEREVEAPPSSRPQKAPSMLCNSP